VELGLSELGLQLMLRELRPSREMQVSERRARTFAVVRRGQEIMGRPDTLLRAVNEL
jgi:hypothetical protein